MESDIDPEAIETKPSRRFRFGLKTLFVVMTALCCWLGGKLSRERRADAMLARHEAVLAALTKQIATPPEGTFYVIGVDSQDKLQKQLSFPGSDFRRKAILDVGHSGSTTTTTLILDVSKLISSNKSADVAAELASYYGANLAAAGMQRTVSGSLGGSEGYSWPNRSVWTSDNNDLVVVIDVEHQAKSPRAFVSVMLIDAQQLHLW